MPIEIKELHIKVIIEEEQQHRFQDGIQKVEQIKEVKSEIARKVTRDILEILKEKQER